MEINSQALYNDCKKYIYCFADRYVKSAADKFYDKAKQTIIDVYYNGYDPIYYHRTNDLMDNSYYKYIKNNGSIRYGGIIISDRDMSDYEGSWFGRYITKASDVLQWAWGKGYHGYLNKDPNDAIYTYPPISSLQIDIKSIIDSGVMALDASSFAKQQSYSVLQF